MIRVAHMVPDFPAVDVYVDDSEEPVFDGLEYTETTGYVDLPAGDHQIRVTAAGSPALVVFDQQVSIPAGNTTAAALAPADSEGSTGGAGSNIQLELFSDENTPPEESINDARLRLIHASPDAPAVNVLVGQTTVFENISYGQAEYFDLPAGDYEFNIVPADGGMTDGPGTGNESDSGTGNESEGGLFSDLAATDGGSEVTPLQQEGNESEEPLPEEGEEEEDAEDVGPEPVYTFDASLESNSVYTAFATGYLDPEAADSDAEFEVVLAQDVIDGEVVEVEDED